MSAADLPPQSREPVSAELFAYLATDPVADLLGIVFEDIRPGYARARMPVTHRLLNAPGTAHGGAMMALIDVVHAAVSNSHGTLAVAQSLYTRQVGISMLPRLIKTTSGRFPLFW